MDKNINIDCFFTFTQRTIGKWNDILLSNNCDLRSSKYLDEFFMCLS